MARTIEEIYNELVAEKENFENLRKLQPEISSFQTLLSDLTSTTKVAIWRLLFYVLAFGIHLLEVVLDLWWEDKEKQRLSFIAGTQDWYVDKVLNFQYGYPLKWEGNKFYFSPEDEEAKIVKYVSVRPGRGNVLIKVAKDDNGEPEPLSETERTALQAYLDEIGFLGIKANVLSQPADEIDLTINVYVDGIILNSSGLNADGDEVVKEAVKKYLAELDFDGVFRVIDLVDAIQKVDGVKNVVVSYVVLINPLQTVDILQSPGQQVETYSGYIKGRNVQINYSL